MTNFGLLIVVATVITTIINFMKPAYVGLVKKKYVGTISIAISFILGIVAAFSFNLGFDLNTGAKVLLGLALGTGSTIWYDLWEVIKSFETKLNKSE